jgi:hypothetical protein
MRKTDQLLKQFLDVAEESHRLVPLVQRTGITDDHGDWIRYYTPEIAVRFGGYQLGGILGATNIRFEAIWMRVLTACYAPSKLPDTHLFGRSLINYPKFHQLPWIAVAGEFDLLNNACDPILDNLSNLPSKMEELLKALTLYDNTNFFPLFEGNFFASVFLPKYLAFRHWIAKEFDFPIANKSQSNGIIDSRYEKVLNLFISSLSEGEI